MGEKKMKLVLLHGVLVLLLAVSTAWAHTLFMSVYDNEDGTVTVEGMYSTGATAASVELRLEDSKGGVLFKAVLDQYGEYTFKKPSVPYEVVLDGGPGHLAREEGP